jgi:N6-L-threonylcarbamoyladenine synthase
MNILGIESTCDETACAVVQDGKKILSNVIFSQNEIHQHWGGVIPELACRRHQDILLSVVDQALEEAGLLLNQIDAVAVAKGPGLIGAVLVGLHGAKGIALANNLPIIGINHIEAHLYAALMGESECTFPALGVILSGGHTTLVKMESIGRYTPISQTIDDAIGEAFDKVARILKLPYPGGPHVERLAVHGDPYRFPFKPGAVKGNPLHFSFSGLKTAVLYSAKGQNKKIGTELEISEQDRCDIAASFQRIAFEDVISKTLLAAKMHDCQTILFGGGVTQNQALRASFKRRGGDLKLIFPEKHLCLDNGAMIAGLAYHKFMMGQVDSMGLEAMVSIVL